MKQSASTTTPSVAQSGGARGALWPNYSPPEDLIFTHGCGSELYAADGTSYLDFLSGIAVTSFGHAHPHLVAALQDQAGKLWHLSNLFRIPAGERLAQRLVDNSFADQVFFANSGTEAIEAGIKAVRGYQASSGHEEKFRLIGFTNSFHGRTIAALAAAGNPAHTKHFIPTDYGFDQVPWGDVAAVQSAIGENTAGIIVEPVQGEGGIRPASASFMQSLRELCDQHGLVLMLDEVQCGMARTGKLFAHEHLGITPDIMSLAKGLGGGFPLGACLTTAEVGQHMVVGTHGSTFGGNPLAMSVGNAILDLALEPSLLPEVSRKGEILRAGIESLIADYPQQLQSVSGLGLMLGVKCILPNGDLQARLRNNRLLVGTAGDNMIRLLPPLNIADAHIQQALDIIAETLKAS